MEIEEIEEILKEGKTHKEDCLVVGCEICKAYKEANTMIDTLHTVLPKHERKNYFELRMGSMVCHNCKFYRREKDDLLCKYCDIAKYKYNTGAE